MSMVAFQTHTFGHPSNSDSWSTAGLSPWSDWEDEGTSDHTAGAQCIYLVIENIKMIASGDTYDDLPSNVCGISFLPPIYEPVAPNEVDYIIHSCSSGLDMIQLTCSILEQVLSHLDFQKPWCLCLDVTSKNTEECMRVIKWLLQTCSNLSIEQAALNFLDPVDHHSIKSFALEFRNSVLEFIKNKPLDIIVNAVPQQVLGYTPPDCVQHNLIKDGSLARYVQSTMYKALLNVKEPYRFRLRVLV
ncbi:hypothetical protein EDD18DRAFT_1115129 [Armillaria luteobubalina]|uniref:Uncharacterized protein n=1 Tax=Armillaria luteobubalina TaxID=153913 RepID=A0AA39P3K4_9AGAR|nr:hypothetical protein EDD18DRAFT_1115129 [Armillaria luteobubalina]